MDNVTLSVTVEQANLIIDALSELPFRVSSPLIKELVDQANAQLMPQQTPPDQEFPFEDPNDILK